MPGLILREVLGLHVGQIGVVGIHVLDGLLDLGNAPERAIKDTSRGQVHRGAVILDLGQAVLAKAPRQFNLSCPSELGRHQSSALRP